MLLWVCLFSATVGGSPECCCGCVPSLLLWLCPQNASVGAQSAAVGGSPEFCCGWVPRVLLWVSPQSAAVGGSQEWCYGLRGEWWAGWAGRLQCSGALVGGGTSGALPSLLSSGLCLRPAILGTGSI